MFLICKKNYKKRGLRACFTTLLIAYALFVGIGGQAGAQEGDQAAETPPKRVITLGEAVRLGIENNLSLENSRITMQTKKRTSDLAWNQFFPAVGFSGSVNSNFIPAESSALNWSTLPPAQVDVKSNSLQLGIMPNSRGLGPAQT